MRDTISASKALPDFILVLDKNKVNYVAGFIGRRKVENFFFDIKDDAFDIDRLPLQRVHTQCFPCSRFLVYEYTGRQRFE